MAFTDPPPERVPYGTFRRKKIQLRITLVLASLLIGGLALLLFARKPKVTYAVVMTVTIEGKIATNLVRMTGDNVRPQSDREIRLLEKFVKDRFVREGQDPRTFQVFITGFAP